MTYFHLFVKAEITFGNRQCFGDISDVKTQQTLVNQGYDVKRVSSRTFPTAAESGFL